MTGDDTARLLSQHIEHAIDELCLAGVRHWWPSAWAEMRTISDEKEKDARAIVLLEAERLVAALSYEEFRARRIALVDDEGDAEVQS